MGSFTIILQPEWVSLPGCKVAHRYDLGRGELPLNCNIKQSMMEYCRSFVLTLREALKRITRWVANYHTRRSSCYPKPEKKMSFSSMPTTLTCRRNVSAWLRSSAKLGFLCWNCYEATYCAPRNNNSRAWHSTRFYLPKTVCFYQTSR